MKEFGFLAEAVLGVPTTRGAPFVQAGGEGVGGGLNPSPKGKKEGWKRKRPKPPTPRGLVGVSE
eukprot:5439561-Pyramimonas_sp.AAC.1